MDIPTAYCHTCNKRWTEDKRFCPSCLSDELETHPISGQGTVYSYTKIHAAPKKYAQDAPYFVVLVDLDEGLRITTRYTGDTIAINDPVVVSEIQDRAYVVSKR